MSVEDEVEVLKQRVAELEARLNRWALHGLAVADTRNVLITPGALPGADITFARSDHSH